MIGEFMYREIRCRRWSFMLSIRVIFCLLIDNWILREIDFFISMMLGFNAVMILIIGFI